MSLPTPGDVHVNVPLTNMSVAYLQSLDVFAADKLAPITPSDKQSNVYFTFPKECWFRDAMKVRAPGAEAAEGGYPVDQGNFFVPVYALKKPIADQTRANEDTPLNSDRNAMQYLTRMERIKREKAFVAACMVTSVWSTDIIGVASGVGAGEVLQWNDAAATPLTDIAVLMTAMQKATGFKPNVLAIGAEVWQYLKFNPQILARITGGATNGNPANVTKQMVAALMELEELVVMEAVENTAADNATMTGDYIAGKSGLLMLRDTTEGPETVTAVKTMTWQQYAGNRTGIRIKKYRDEPKSSDLVEIEGTFAHKIIASDVGTFITTLVA